LALVFVVYLALDFVDASAPGVFFFDSALFLGTVVQSKVRSVDAVDHAPAPCMALDHGLPTVASERRPILRDCWTSRPVTTKTPLARDAISRSAPLPTAEDH
jgi:hypothetical protein